MLPPERKRKKRFFFVFMSCGIFDIIISDWRSTCARQRSKAFFYDTHGRPDQGMLIDLISFGL